MAFCCSLTAKLFSVVNSRNFLILSPFSALGAFFSDVVRGSSAVLTLAQQPTKMLPTVSLTVCNPSWCLQPSSVNPSWLTGHNPKPENSKKNPITFNNNILFTFCFPKQICRQRKIQLRNIEGNYSGLCMGPNWQIYLVTSGAFTCLCRSTCF